MHVTDDTRQRYFPYIDGLRAVAVLSVIAYHLDPRLLPGGFTGVDVFFVISGFVVSASMAHLHRARLLDYLGYFYARRIRRIAPALIVCLMITGIASALFIPQAWLSDTSHAVGRWAFVGLSNFVLLRTDGDYFSPKVEFNPYTHTWSLGVEEQFYVLFPLLFFAWAFGARGRSWSMGLFGLGFIGSLAYVIHIAEAKPALAFYMLTTRFWQLAAGVLLFQTLSARAHGQVAPPRAVANAGALVSFGLLAYGLATARAGHSPWPDSMPAVLGTLGLLGFLYPHDAGGRLRSLLESTPVRWIGRLSYSLYLWHWPVFVLMRWTVGLESLSTRIVALAATLVLAALSFYFIETPFRRAAVFRRAHKLAVIGVGVVAIFAFMGVYRKIGRMQPEISLSVTARHAADWYPMGSDTRPVYPDCAAAGRIERVPDANLRIYSKTSCAEPPVSGRVFVIGDSHATAYMGLYAKLAVETGRDVYLYSRPGCSFLSLQASRDNAPQCRAFGDAALSDVQTRAKRGDVLFLPALRLPRYADQWVSFDPRQVHDAVFGAQAVEGRREAEQAARGMLTPLAERGVAIVFEAPKPVFRSPPYRCADWYSRSNPACREGLTMSRAELERLRKPVLDSLESIVAQMPGASVWDPFSILCPGATCYVEDDGRPLYFDGDHISGYANRKLTPAFVGHLSAMQPTAASTVR
ncbi:acyltransferase family protein [Lysobacter arvi]|uniref:Acyltransferase family protein n=1 Tax=Lysobacter arvi TaxID=3038776 RepID=A0ABU1CCZ3_9GAMM|nr:acyltransferase family protein [Lysobacter arvi]MDR0182274.1 acyltransferase family protein [Lysobacter arvi]